MYLLTMQIYFRGVLNDQELECVSAVYGDEKVI